MTDFWIGSSEYRRWWDGEPAHVVGPVASDGALGLDLQLVELERTGERVLMGQSIPVPVRPGMAIGVRVFDPPDGWNEGEPIEQRTLVGFTEPELYARPEDLPVVDGERRERIRRGWGFQPARDLRFRTEAALYAEPQVLPVVSTEYRERVRRGWAY